MNWMNVSALSLIVLLAACGDDAASKSKTESNNTNTSNNTNAGNNTTVTPTTSFDVSVGDNTYQREVDNTQATQESAAAVIAQNLVNLYMVSTDGVSISAVVETTPTRQRRGASPPTHPRKAHLCRSSTRRPDKGTTASRERSGSTRVQKRLARSSRGVSWAYSCSPSQAARR